MRLLTPPVIEARRLLHCSYCGHDGLDPVPLLRDGFGWVAAVEIAPRPIPGNLLAVPGDVSLGATMVFDDRGPRQSPALEVQQWVDPPAVGDPEERPWSPGVRAVGLATSHTEWAARTAERRGWRVVGRTDDAPADAGAGVVLRDPSGVCFDLVEDRTLPAGAVRFAYLRLAVSDLHRSVEWYGRLGYRVDAATQRVVTSGIYGASRPLGLTSAALELPEGPGRLVLQQWDCEGPRSRHYARPNHRGLYRFAVAVDDARAAVERLAGAGIPVERPAELVELPETRLPGLWIAVLRDPDGIPVELVERPSSHFRGHE